MRCTAVLGTCFLSLCWVTAESAAQPQSLVAVALSARDSVAFFDAHTLERVATLAVGRTPHEIATTPDGRRILVADAGDTTITVIEAAPLPRVVATWALPDSLSVHDVAVSPDGRTVWGVDGRRQQLLELDATTGALRRRVALERAGGWLVDADGPGGGVVIAHLEGGALTLVDPVTGAQRIIASIPGEIDAAATPDGSELWSMNTAQGVLTIFSAATGAVLHSEREMPGASRVRFLPDRRSAVLVVGGDSTAHRYDVPTRTRVKTLKLPHSPKIVALSRDGRHAYVSMPGGALALIDVPSMTLLRAVPLEGTPDGVAVLEVRPRE